MKRLKHRMPSRAEWARILEAIGPSGVQPAEYLPNWIRSQRDMLARLQECVREYKLGLGGEKVDVLVIAELRRLRSMSELCEQCDGKGWYAVENGRGESKQKQCESCYGTGMKTGGLCPVCHADPCIGESHCP